MTFCPHEKRSGNATNDYRWQRGNEKERVAAAPKRSLRVTTTVIGGGRAALATDYSESSGPLFRTILSPGPSYPHTSFLWKNNTAEQGAADYDPQLVAMRWPFLAAIVYSTAVGRA